MSVGDGRPGPGPVCGWTFLLRGRNASTSVVPSVDRPPRSPALLVGMMCLLTRQVVVARSDHHPAHWRGHNLAEAVPALVATGRKGSSRATSVGFVGAAGPLASCFQLPITFEHLIATTRVSRCVRHGCSLMPDWLGWLVFAGLLGVVELVTLRFAAGLIALAAITAAVVAAVGGGPL